MLSFVTRLLRDTSANVLALSALGTLGLIGGAGLSVDAVYWYSWKRQLQQAVDSGALAGAYALSEGKSVSAAAQNDIGKNANTSITLESAVAPPTSGAYTGNSTAVEVIANTSRELPFTSLFLANPPTIRARAVSAYVSEGEHCIISLAKTGIGVNVAGNADVLLTCGVAANSEDGSAIDLDGTSWMTGSPLSAVGGINFNDQNIPADTVLNPYGAAQKDPLASRNLTPPSSPSACTYNNFQVQPSQNITIYPGRYCGGLNIKGTVVMEPGVYIIDRGSLTINSQANVTGEGVTFVLTGTSTGNMATTAISGGATLDLRAPTLSEDGTWHGILIFQNALGSSQRNNIAGDSSFNMEGIIYMPHGEINFTGSSGQHSECLLMVAYRVSLSGESSLENNCPSDYDDLDTSGRRMRIVE